MFSLGITFVFHPNLEQFCFMLKSVLCPWNLPSLLPSPAAQLQAQVSSRAAANKAQVSLWALSLLCPQSIHEEGAGHSFTVFSIKMHMYLMLVVDFLSPCPLFHFLVFLCPDFHCSDWGFPGGCLCNLMLSWVWWCNLCKWSKWRAQVLPHGLILGCALWCVTWKVKVRRVHCLSQIFFACKFMLSSSNSA